MNKTILHLCADTGSDTRPYKDEGYKVVLIGKDIGVENYHPTEDIHGVIANPVCTEFSTARTGGKPRNPDKGMEMVKECQRIIQECKPNFWVIENPASGALRKYLGGPIYTYQPWWYGSPWTKGTALWGKFNIPPRLYYKWEDVPKLNGLYYRPGRVKPALASMHKSHVKYIPEFSCFNPESDAEFRSLCSQKFATAFMEANR
jgi:hypothetical protein